MLKIVDREALIEERRRCREQGRRVVMTNGCFDLIHPGHIRYLRESRALGDVLIVAVNSDDSTRRLKGPGRPIFNQEERCEVLAALEVVDYVTVFDEATPIALIAAVLPDVLVKGGDWPPDQIVGREDVEAAGGRVYSLPYSQGYSTTNVIKRILRLSS